ncbi:MAG: helix-turn-helix transcriptional regulator [Hyphomicrobium aestuarii]|nr:helix-turn-helix transcriptional regulator [Hyphomicrobium aestuarii]
MRLRKVALLITQYTGWIVFAPCFALIRMKLRRTVARNLRRLRAERNLSQEALADLAELNRNYVGMIERCENAATVDTLEALAKALNVEVKALIDDGPQTVNGAP